MKKLLNILISLLVAALPLLAVRTASAAVGSNLITNPSAETADPATATLPADWTADKWGANTSTFAYQADGNTGTKSLYVQTTAYTDGDAKWVAKPVSVQPGQSYTFSDFYKSNITSELVAQYFDSTGKDTYQWFKTIAASPTAWTKTTQTFTTPATASQMRVFHLIAQAGWLQIDDVTLGTADTAPTPPTVSITAPLSNATVSNSTTIAATAADAVAVAGVQFKLDGTNVGAEDTTAPYSLAWDTKTTANGAHTISAVARNSTNQTTAAANVAVTVNNVATPPVDPAHMIPNASVETADPANAQKPQFWSNSSWGTNTHSFTYVTGGHTGTKSIKTTISSFTTGDAKWFFDPIAVEAGKTYNYSHYYMSNAVTDVVAQFTDANGNDSYQWLATIGASATWKQYTASFVIPAGTVKATVIQTLYSLGWLQIDDANMAKDVPPSIVSFIANNSLETAATFNPLAPASWSTGSWGQNTPTYTYMNEGHNSTHSVKLTVTNYLNGDAKWFFDPISTLTPGSFYRFSTWYKTNTIPKAVVQFNKADGTETYFGMPNPQPNGTANWQFYTDTFLVPKDAKSMTVFFFLDGNGWVQVDEQAIGTYTPVSFNRPLVSLTFDDGFEENNKTVLPIANSYGFKTTQCYATQFIGQTSTGPAHVLEFKNSGHEICSHTVTHPFLTKISTTKQDQELSQAKTYLEKLTGGPIKSFASPYGDYNAAVNNEIRKFYRSHRTVDEGFNSKDNFDIYRIRVQNMTPTTTLAEYQSWLDTAKATNTWLVLVYHKVASANLDPFDTYTSDFVLQMKALSNSGITVKTYNTALDEVTAQL